VTQCIAAMCVVGIVVLALAVITGRISAEELASLLAKGFVGLFFVFWACCLARPITEVARGALLSAAAWLIVAGIAALSLCGLIALATQITNRFEKKSHQGEHENE
jgi:hypothetical protein